MTKGTKKHTTLLLIPAVNNNKPFAYLAIAPVLAASGVYMPLDLFIRKCVRNVYAKI